MPGRSDYSRFLRKCLARAAICDYCRVRIFPPEYPVMIYLRDDGKPQLRLCAPCCRIYHSLEFEK